MKKISMIIFALVVATNAATFSELEKRVADLEEQVTKLTIKLLDREMAKESPILNMAVDTTTSISGLIDSTLIESDEDEGEEKEVQYKSRDQVDWKEVNRQLEEIEKNEIMIEFLLCKMKLIDRVSFDTPNYNNVIDSIAHSEDRELIFKECKK